jgi:hypothetical protein
MKNMFLDICVLGKKNEAWRKMGKTVYNGIGLYNDIIIPLKHEIINL